MGIVASGDFVVVYLLVVIFVVFLIICNKVEKFRGLSLHVLVHYRILKTQSLSMYIHRMDNLPGHDRHPSGFFQPTNLLENQDVFNTAISVSINLNIYINKKVPQLKKK